MTVLDVVGELAARCADLDDVAAADVFLARWEATWAWITSPDVGPTLLAALDRPDGASLEASLARFQRRALATQERAETDALLARLGPPGGRVRGAVSSPFGVATYDRVVEAARLVDFGGCARAAVVGGGPFPAAALFLRDATAVPTVDVYDVDAAAVARVERWAAWCADGRLRPRRADGAAVDFAGVDVVYVVNQVAPKRAVLRRVRDTAPPGVRILLREPVGLGRLVAERGLASPVDGLVVVAEGTTSPAFLSRHVLLVRVR